MVLSWSKELVIFVVWSFHLQDVQRLKNLRAEANYFEDNKKGNDHEDLNDHTLVEQSLLFSPEEAAKVKKGLTRPGLASRRVSFQVPLSEHTLGHQYSIKHGYQPRPPPSRSLVYGRRASRGGEDVQQPPPGRSLVYGRQSSSGGKGRPQSLPDRSLVYGRRSSGGGKETHESLDPSMHSIKRLLWARYIDMLWAQSIETCCEHII